MNTLDQLARTSLLPKDLASAILAGHTPRRSDLVWHLLIGSIDAHLMTTGDPKCSWTERRLSHQNLINTFLLALIIDGLPAEESREEHKS